MKLKIIFELISNKHKIELLEKIPDKLELLKCDMKWCHLNWNLIKKYIPPNGCICCFKQTQIPVLICEYRHPLDFRCLMIHKRCIICENTIK